MPQKQISIAGVILLALLTTAIAHGHRRLRRADRSYAPAPAPVNAAPPVKIERKVWTESPIMDGLGTINR